MRKIVIGTLIFLLIFSITAPGFTAAAEAPFNATESYTENGVEYKNVAIGKSYTSTGGVYGNAKWTEVGSDGKPLGKYTDGVVAEDGGADAIGCYQSAETIITIDLGKVHAIKRLVTDIYGLASWGIPDPDGATVSVSFSTDGSNFSNAQDAQKSDELVNEGWKLRLFTLTLNQTVSARYVQVKFKLNGNFLWASEIAVYGKDQTSESSSSSSSASSSSSSSTPASSSSSSTPASSSSSTPASSSSSSTSASSSSATSSSNPITGENDYIYIYAIIGIAALASIMVVVRNRKKTVH